MYVIEIHHGILTTVNEICNIVLFKTIKTIPLHPGLWSKIDVSAFCYFIKHKLIFEVL